MGFPCVPETGRPLQEILHGPALKRVIPSATHAPARRAAGASATAVPGAVTLAAGGQECEVRARPELEKARDEIRREFLDRSIELADGRVEVAAGVLDRFFDLAEGGPERLEVGGRLEIRIRLGQREEAAQGLAELSFGPGAGPGCLGRHRRAAGLYDGVEDAPLVRCVALDRLHEVRHEIGSALEL